MSKFCECCGQPLPGTEEMAVLFDGRLTITHTGMFWEEGECRLTKSEAFVMLAMARAHPRAVNANFIVDYLENCQELMFSAEDTKIVDVFTCKIRKKMFDAKCPFQIATIWGIGKHLIEGPAADRVYTASHYPRDAWIEAKHADEGAQP